MNGWKTDDDGVTEINVSDEEASKDDRMQWHAGPVNLNDNGYWAWNLIESPDLAEEWNNYRDYVPSATCHLN